MHTLVDLYEQDTNATKTHGRTNKHPGPLYSLLQSSLNIITACYARSYQILWKSHVTERIHCF